MYKSRCWSNILNELIFQKYLNRALSKISRTSCFGFLSNHYKRNILYPYRAIFQNTSNGLFQNSLFWAYREFFLVRLFYEIARSGYFEVARSVYSNRFQNELFFQTYPPKSGFGLEKEDYLNSSHLSSWFILISRY